MPTQDNPKNKTSKLSATHSTFGGNGIYKFTIQTTNNKDLYRKMTANNVYAYVQIARSTDLHTLAVARLG